MSSPEQDVIVAIAERIGALRLSLSDTMDLAGRAPPADMQAFNAMPKIERVASSALIKSVEQLEDQLARLFRTILRELTVDTTGWFAQDTANRMEQMGLVSDADRWVEIVKLRNRLIHDYPLDQEAQFKLLREAYAAAAFLDETSTRAIAFLTERGWI